jgi:hypothetical protein
MDDSLAKAPGIKTVTAYHSALESMEDTSKVLVAQRIHIEKPQRHHSA